MVVFIKYFWRKSVLCDKKEKHLTQLVCDYGCMRKVRMIKNEQNEKHFPRRLNTQVCELLQVLTEASMKRFFEK